jgi:hypothetical protein
MFYFIYKKNSLINYIFLENNIKKKYRLKITRRYRKKNIFLSNRIISYKWDIFCTKYGLYKCFKNSDCIGNSFMIYPNKIPSKFILEKFKNKKLYIKPTTKSCFDTHHFRGGKDINMTDKINYYINNKLNSKNYYFVQESIDNPYLMDGCKADFRFYILVTKNSKNFVFYLYKKGTIRKNQSKYNDDFNVYDKITGGWAQGGPAPLKAIEKEYLKDCSKNLLTSEEIAYFIKKIWIKLKIPNNESREKLEKIIDFKSKNEIKCYLEEKNVFDKDIKFTDEYLRVLEIYKSLGFYNFYCTDILEKELRDNIYNSLKKKLQFNFFENLPKTNNYSLNEYQLFSIDVGYDNIKKESFIMEFNGKIVRPHPVNKFENLFIDKEKIIYNLIEGKHINVGDFEKIFHIKI